MWLFNKTLAIFALISALLLGGCDFRPVYYKSNDPDSIAIQEELKSIRIDTLDNRNGQLLHNYLVDALDYDHGYHNTSKTIALKIHLADYTQSLGTKIEGDATRERLVITATYTLIEIATRKELVNYVSTTSVHYNLVPEQYGIIVAKQTAQNKALRALSDQIITRLNLYFKARHLESQAS